MSERQWLRNYELTIGKGGGEGLKTSALRVSFSIKKSDTESPNEAVIQVWNLADETLQRSKKEFDRVILQAGYQENYGMIYSGNIIGQRIVRENGVDIVLELTCGDGDEAYTSAVINKTLAAGANSKDIVGAVQGSFGEYGVTPGETPALGEQRLPRGKVMFGMTRKYAREAAYTSGASWSIQDGKMTMVKNDGYLSGEAVVLTYKTGLVGAPEQTNDGLNVKCLLNPKIQVNGRIKIDNASVQEAKKETGKDAKQPAALDADGFYRVIKITYAGDTHGQDWRCDMACVSIDATAGKTTDTKG
jgi:hypothetical protein